MEEKGLGKGKELYTTEQSRNNYDSITPVMGKSISENTISLISYSVAVEVRKCFGALTGDTRVNKLYGDAVLCPAILGSAPYKRSTL